MASDSAETDWRPLISASDRFENILKIKAILVSSNPEAAATAQSEAFKLETQAYDDSSSRTQYDEVCRLIGQTAKVLSNAEAAAHERSASLSSIGVRIGQYSGCLPVAGGVTSEVYRCKDRALKVIVETHHIEPHSPQREAKILATLHRPCIPLLEKFRDQEQRFVLVFPFMPLTLAALLERGPLPQATLKTIFRDVFTALADLHGQGIIHRDIKPEAILLESPEGPAYLSDFGTAWHPELSIHAEPTEGKVLDIGTGPYRAPECLFGDKAYGSPVDMWAAGTMLAECCRNPPKPLFESRPAHEDGNQLGLILSIFKTLGTPTKETWPEAVHFKTPPFEMYRVIEGLSWEEILPGVDPELRDLVARLIRYDSKRATAQELREHPLFN